MFAKLMLVKTGFQPFRGDRLRERLQMDGSGKDEVGGFGKKLLLKMGWKEGKGLGKEGEGIVNPIEVNLRPKGTGLGFFDEPDAQAVQQDLFRPRTPDVKKDEVGPYERPWKKQHKEPARKDTEEYEIVSSVHKTVEIIDMTGKGHQTTRLAANYHSHDATDLTSPFPELIQAVRRISIRSNNQLGQLKTALAQQNADKGTLSLELANCQEMIQKHEAEIARKRTLHELVQKGKLQVGLLRNALLNDEPVVEAWRSLFKIGDELEQLNRQTPSLETVKIALALFSEPLKAAIPGWSPLCEQDDLAEIFHVLSQYEFRPSPSEDPIDLSHQLLMRHWLPNARAYLVNNFDPLDERFATFAANWIPLMKAEVRSILLDMILVKKIEEAVENTRSLAELSWVQGWIPLMAEYKDFISSVRRRLSKFLEHFSLSEHKAIIVHWSAVLPRSESELLLARAVLPTLASHLDRNFVIDPAAQDIDPLMEVLDWSDTIPADFMADLIKSGLFVKLRRTLHAWITGADADFGEITEWYEAWKTVLPEDLQEHPVIQQEYTYLLVMMDALVEDPSLPVSRFL